MNKLLTSAAIAIIIAFMWLGFRLAEGTPQVRAAQCWDPGCCGPELVYNQWSCQSAEASDLCRDIGELPTWVCGSNGKTHSNPIICRYELCNVHQPCEWRCPISDSWGKQCVITSGSVRCSHPDDLTCTANVIAKQCQSQADVNDCYDYNGEPDVRQCWVEAVDPTPVPGSSCFGCSQPSGGFCMWYEGNCPSWGGNCNACQPQPEPPTPTPTPAYGRLEGLVRHQRTDGSLNNVRCDGTMYAPQPVIHWRRISNGATGTIGYGCGGYANNTFYMGQYEFTVQGMGGGAAVDGWRLANVATNANVSCSSLNNESRQVTCTVNSWGTNRLDFHVVANPRGIHDGPGAGNNGPRCDHIYGWTCDPDNHSSSINARIHGYRNGSFFVIKEVNAPNYRTDAEASCNGTSNHGFQYWFTDQDAATHNLWNGQPITFYVHGVNVGGGVNVELHNSGQSVTCNDYSVSGTVYNRHSSSGLYNSTLGICSGATAGVYGGGTVRLYNASNVLVGQAAVAGNGTYTIRTGTRTAGTYRLELVGLPDPYVCGCEASLNDDYQCVYNSLKVDNLLSHCNDFGCTANFYVEPTFTVSGTVREGEAEGAYCASQMANRGPVAGATVRTIIPMLGDIERQSVSDANGAYSFERLRYATYNLIIDMPPPLPEYYPFCPRTGNQDVSVTTANVPNVDFYLSTFKISGTVYDRHTSVGLYDAGLGVCGGATSASVYGGGTVTAYNSAGVAVGSATVGGDGRYIIYTNTITEGDYRLELTGLTDSL